MIDILLRDGDLVASKYDDISLCADEDNDIIQAANNNILLRFRGHKFHSELGNKAYNRRIKANQNGIEMVRTECTKAIMNSDPRIREVRQVTVTLMEDASCLVNYILVYAKTKEIISTNNTNIGGDIVDTIKPTKTEEEELVEVDGRAYINVFNMEGGDR